jgi:hypothetical protein
MNGSKVHVELELETQNQGIHRRLGRRRPAASPAGYIADATQGAFIVSMVKDSADIAATSGDHLRRYVELLFRPAIHRGREIE